MIFHPEAKLGNPVEAFGLREKRLHVRSLHVGALELTHWLPSRGSSGAVDGQGAKVKWCRLTGSNRRPP